VQPFGNSHGVFLCLAFVVVRFPNPPPSTIGKNIDQNKYFQQKQFTGFRLRLLNLNIIMCAIARTFLQQRCACAAIWVCRPATGQSFVPDALELVLSICFNRSKRIYTHASLIGVKIILYPLRYYTICI